jgi:hypothetical protein
MFVLGGSVRGAYDVLPSPTPCVRSIGISIQAYCSSTPRPLGHAIILLRCAVVLPARSGLVGLLGARGLTRD